MSMEHEYHGVRPGSILYLFDIQNKFLYGPYVATTRMATYEEKAWEGRFKCQVKFKEIDLVPPTSKPLEEIKTLMKGEIYLKISSRSTGPIKLIANP
jgi:hypothetical protein